jgi:hypothetical protein
MQRSENVGRISATLQPRRNHERFRNRIPPRPGVQGGGGDFGHWIGNWLSAVDMKQKGHFHQRTSNLVGIQMRSYKICN